MAVRERQDPVITLLLFSAPAFFIELPRFAMIFLVADYALTTLDVRPSTIATAYLIARVFSFFCLGLVGYLADNISLGFGRRRLFLVAGGPLLTFSCWLALLPGGGSVGTLAAVFCLFEFSIALFEIPHLAWCAELARTYKARSRVFQWRTTSTFLGASAAFAIAALAGARGDLIPPNALGWCAAATLVGLPITTALQVMLRNERAPEGYNHPERSLSVSIRAYTSSPILIRLVFGGGLAILGMAIDLSLHATALKSVIGRPDGLQALLFLEMLSAAIFTAVWVRFAGSWGKNQAIAATLIFGGLAGLPLILIGEGDVIHTIIFVCLRGSAFGGIIALLFAMAADATDVDTYRTGDQRSGGLIAVLLASWQVFAIIGIWAGAAFLEKGGFVVSDEPGNPGETLFVITYALLPFLAFSFAAMVLWTNPVDEKVQKEVREELSRIKKKML